MDMEEDFEDQPCGDDFADSLPLDTVHPRKTDLLTAAYSLQDGLCTLTFAFGKIAVSGCSADGLTALFWLTNVAPRVLEARPVAAEAYRLYEQSFNYHGRSRVIAVTDEVTFINFVNTRGDLSRSILSTYSLAELKKAQKLETQTQRRHVEAHVLDSEKARNAAVLPRLTAFVSQSALRYVCLAHTFIFEHLHFLLYLCFLQQNCDHQLASRPTAVANIEPT
jgi:hypothetical protein